MRKLVRSTVLNSVSDRPSAKEAWRRAAAIMFVPADVIGVPAASRWLNTARQELVSSLFACLPGEVCQESMSVALFVLLCACRLCSCKCHCVCYMVFSRACASLSSV